MLPSLDPFSRSSYRLILIAIAGVLLVSCSPPVQKPVGPAREYLDAKDLFKRGQFDRALEFTDGLATASPPTRFTERALVLRAVIYTGELKCYKDLAEAYSQGADKTKDRHIMGEFGRLRHDNLQYAARAALGLAETAHQLVTDGVIAKELTLEVNLPATEGPVEVKDLKRVAEGGWIEPDEQESVAHDSLLKGIDDAFADAVSGDRAKAHSALASGSTKLNGLDFAIFLGDQLAEGAIVFDRKHSSDSQKVQMLCTEGNDVVKAALALLKDNPDKEKEKEVKKIQDRYKAILKSLEHVVWE
jgi:hypothetical protein